MNICAVRLVNEAIGRGKSIGAAYLIAARRAPELTHSEIVCAWLRWARLTQGDGPLRYPKMKFSDSPYDVNT